MTYNTLADMIEKHQPALARAIATEGLAQGLKTYQGFALDPFALLIEKTVANLARYVRNGNPAEYEAYVVQLVRERIAQGRDTDDVLALSDIMYEQIQLMIMREWAGEANKITRERFLQKINGIRTFGHITFRATRLEVRRVQN